MLCMQEHTKERNKNDAVWCEIHTLMQRSDWCEILTLNDLIGASNIPLSVYTNTDVIFSNKKKIKNPLSLNKNPF